MARKKRPKTAAQRVAAHRARVAADGGRQIAIMLDNAAVEKLNAWQEKGETITNIVNRLLRRSKPWG